MPKEKTTKEVKEVKRVKRVTLLLWHQRLSYISEKATRFLLKDIYRDELAPNHPIGALEEHFTKCEPCIKASLTNKVNKESRNSLREYHYLDKATRHIEAKLLRTKDEVYEAFIEFKARAENNPDKYKIRIFATDNGGEYVNSRFQKLFKEAGITHQTVPAYTKEPN